ncbi:MAG: hypothetical protein JSS66_12975 [Armatimonadetes bacterium]|nr:hypothetical protein [Armatimonadota bacterium]
MTAQDLARHAMDETGHQLFKSLDGLSADQWDAKADAHLMSPRETVSHLCDCYAAYRAAQQGGTYEWGSYKLAATDGDGMIAELKSNRDAAIASLGPAGEEKALKDSMAYIALHDAYHVGQICALRLKLNPAWDPYSIYQG